MSHVVRQDIDALNAQIIVTLTADDYGKKIQDQIKKYSKNAQMKGFRPGKVPEGLIKKMYGKAFLVEIVNEGTSEQLNKFMESQKDTKFLGQPIMAQDQAQLSLSLDNPKDIITKFDIGIEPEFELEGLDKTTELSYYEVQISENLVDEEVARIRKQAATEQELQQIKYENDYITLGVTFNKDGEIKENSFGILAQDLTPEARKTLNTKFVGDKFMFNLYNLEQESTDDNVKTYFLGLAKDETAAELGTDFEIEIKQIMNRKEADLNQAFFDQYFGEGVVNNETQMREFVRRMLASQQYLSMVNSLLFRDFQNSMMEKNNIELPEAFLKRWLTTVDEKNTAEVVESGFEGFANNLKWSIVRRKIAERANIRITEEELQEYYRMRVRGYLGGQENAELENMLLERTMQDEKQWNDLIEDFITESVFGYARTQISLVPNPISAQDFDVLVAKLTGEGANVEELVAEEVDAE